MLHYMYNPKLDLWLWLQEEPKKEPEPEPESEESDVEIDQEGVIEGDSDPAQDMGDETLEVSTIS